MDKSLMQYFFHKVKYSEPLLEENLEKDDIKVEHMEDVPDDAIALRNKVQKT